jgi:hypothetical protein
MELRKQIERAINTASAENGSNTPDFILARFLTDCLAAFDRATNAREKWCGRSEAVQSTPIDDINKERAATKTLEAVGYTYHGGELWKPPLGSDKLPLLTRIAKLEATLNDCLEIAGSDCEHALCKAIIERVSSQS